MVMVTVEIQPRELYSYPQILCLVPLSPESYSSFRHLSDRKRDDDV
jgi:hypothetical protein